MMNHSPAKPSVLTGREEIHLLQMEAKELGIDDEPLVRRFFRSLRVDPYHPVARRHLEGRMASVRHYRDLYGTPFHPPPRVLPGDVFLGEAEECPAQFNLGGMSGNVFGLGGSGAGKTNLLLHIMPQVARKVPVWCFEYSKGELKRSLWLYRQNNTPLVVFRSRDECCNVFEPPPGVLPQRWPSRLTEMLTEIVDFSEQMQALFTKHVSREYERLGVFRRSQKYPVLSEIIKAIEGDESANKQSRESLLRRLRSLADDLHLFMPNSLRFRCGFDIRDLADVSIHWDLHGVSRQVQALVTYYRATGLFEYLNSATEPNQGVRNLVVFEEAMQFLSGSHNKYMGYLFSQVRGVGISFAAFVQTLCGIPDSVLANCGMKILGRVTHAPDLKSFASSMGVSTARETRWLIENLRPGRFLVKLSVGEFLRPFVVTVPRVPSLHPVIDAYIRESQHALNRSSLVPVEKQRVKGGIKVESQTGSGKQRLSASADELHLLTVVKNHPDMPSSQYAKLIGMKTQKCISLRKRLVEQRWLSEFTLDHASRGGRSIVAELTDQGREVLEHSDASGKQLPSSSC